MKSLGLFTLIALVIGNMVGSGIFLLPSSLAQYGSISIVAWIITSFGALLIAIIFSRLSKLLPKSGGPYAYCNEAYGNFIGFLIAYLYWIYSWVGNAAIATSLVSYFSYFYPNIFENNFISFISIVSIIWLLTFINIIGISKAGKLQFITVFLKLIPLVLVAFLGLGFIHLHYFHAFNMTNHSNFLALSGSATITLWALTGVESATVPSEHVINPQRNIPLATLIGTSVAIILYILSTVVIMGIIPMHKLATTAAPFAEAAKLTIGTFGAGIIAGAAIISSIGALNGWILLQGQVSYAASINKVFPKSFAKLSKQNTPINSLIISSLLITFLLMMNFNKNLIDKFTFIISLATITILIVYAVTITSEIVILIKQKNYKHFKRKIIINILALVYVSWAFYGANHKIILYTILLILSGIPMYLWCKWKNSVMALVLHKKIFNNRGEIC